MRAIAEAAAGIRATNGQSRTSYNCTSGDLVKEPRINWRGRTWSLRNECGRVWAIAWEEVRGEVLLGM